MGSGCDAVGRAVTSNIRGPGFEYSHWQLLLNIYLLLTVKLLKKKRPGMAHFLKKTSVAKLFAEIVFIGLDVGRTFLLSNSIFVPSPHQELISLPKQ